MENLDIVNVSTRKRRKSECSDLKFKTQVNNVYNYLVKIKSLLLEERLDHLVESCGLTIIHQRVSDLFDVSKSSVFKMMKSEGDDENKENYSAETTIIEKIVSRKSPTYKCDDFMVAMLRRNLQEFYARKEYPDVRTILAKCKEDINFPPISKSTLLTWLTKHCHMKYRKINKKPVFLERTDIKAQREYYLREIRKYRQDNYTIFYSDETWSSPDQTRRRCWQMFLTDAEYKSLFKNTYSGDVLRDMNGWTGGFLAKSGAGRVIINHIGSCDGFLKGGDDLFVSKKDTKDYHGTMDFARYRIWFEKILKLVPDKSVLVLDQAPYHRKRVENTINPTTAWRKGQIINWLKSFGVSVPTGLSTFNQLTRPELLKLAREHPVKTKYIVEEMADNCEKDVKVLWLPVAHCEFNPIELIWSPVKGYIAKHNTGKTVDQILNLAREALDTITPEIWKNCVAHVIKYEDAMWQRDRLLEDNFFGDAHPFTIHLEDGDTTSSSDDEDI